MISDQSPVGKREFKWPMTTMLNAINDLIELQKGEITSDDISQGKISFKVEMYGFIWENHFVVTQKDEGSSIVTLTLDGDVTKRAVRISRQLALLESLLVGNGISENVHIGVPADTEHMGMNERN